MVQWPSSPKLKIKNDKKSHKKAQSVSYKTKQNKTKTKHKLYINEKIKIL